jgi:hypothetical protein
LGLRRGKLDIWRFSEQEILARLGERPSARYLGAYLEELGVTTVLEEDHYVDRHFVEDFAAYYARSFNAPEPYCGRLHFFKDVSLEALSAEIERAYRSDSDRERVETSLRDSYAGFVVRRPLNGAKIGRTVLCTYDSDNSRRHYTVVRPYKVNVAGLRFGVRGLAYQQQDRGAAVCASTALWSALQQVATLSGNRTPTPSDVTRAAASPFPASQGLSSSQMATALSALGYAADLLTPNGDLKLFRAKLVACLLSHLPVVLLLESSGGQTGHAITVTGFSEPRALVDVTVAPRVPSFKMKAGSADVVYVHDDNLGSHAHYELFDSAASADELMIRRGRSNRPPVPWWNVDELSIVAALVPKPQKLRLPIDDLFLSILLLRRMIEQELPGLELHYSARFSTGVDYRDELLRANFNIADRREFHERLTLPRFVGVISVLHEDVLLVDFALDVSEIAQEVLRPPVLALACPGVPLLSAAHANLKRVARHFDCPIITGPPDASGASAET